MVHLERDPIPILYVLSNGRSSSTLLDRLLGSHPSMFALGEVQALPHELREHRDPCDCGAPIDSCSFWGPFAGSKDLEELAHFRESNRSSRVIRPRHLLDRIHGAPRGERAREAERFARSNARILRSIWQRANEHRAEENPGEPIRWLVDASGDPYRLEWLKRDPEFDVRLVHLYKQPGSFVHSERRREGGYGLLGTLRQALRWRVENGLMQHLFRRFPAERRTLICYDRLVTEPVSMLERIAAICDLDASCFSTDAFRAPQHGVASSAMHWRSSGIQLDDSWRSELPIGYRLAASALCGGLAKRLNKRARRVA